MDQIRGILDPYNEGVRRAVVNDLGLVRDRKHEPGKTECDVLSEVCRLVFDGESRDAKTLLHRACVENMKSAWDALYDDIRLGLTIPNTESYMPQIMAQMRGPSSAKALYVCGVLAVDHAKKSETLKIREPFELESVVAVIESFSRDSLYSDIVDAYQQVMHYTIPAIEDVADTITRAPKTCILFLKHPHIDALCTLYPTLAIVLSDAAASVPVTARQPYLTMLALMVRHGHRVKNPVALQTLTSLRSQRFHLNLAASSAVVAMSQPDQDPTVASLCMLIETLCTVIQKSCNVDTMSM